MIAGVIVFSPRLQCPSRHGHCVTNSKTATDLAYPHMTRRRGRPRPQAVLYRDPTVTTSESILRVVTVTWWPP
eukprot:1845219-Rhodomonas_salina.4